MGEYAIKMPDIGEGIAEVEVVEWRVQPGDMVAEDQILADVMTDKATIEIPSPVAGTVLTLGGKPGVLMAVGAELIRLEIEGTGNTAPRSKFEAAETASPAAVQIGPDGAAPVTVSPQPWPTAKTVAPPAPAAGSRLPAAAPLSAVASSSSVPPMRAVGEKPIASPAVRHRAWEMGVELQFVHGSGPVGRITHEDLDSYVSSRGQPRGAASVSTYAQRQGEEVLPLIGLRRKIAQKMQEAKRRIPHFSYVEEIDVTELEALRGKLNDRYGVERGKLTLLPLLVRAVVLAVVDFPQMNARFDDDNGMVVRHAPVHLGIATQTDAGLIVPVIRHAETMNPWVAGQEIARLAAAARDGSASRDELSGSTLTISSLGPLGGIVTTPVINHPEVAIIGVNRIVERPVFRNGVVVGRKLMNLSSSFDHRVVDGMDAAEFIQAIRALLETPALLFVD